MFDNLYCEILSRLPPGVSFLAVTGKSLNARELLNKIAGYAYAFIMAAAIIYGAWMLFEGFCDNSSATKKQGFITILGGVALCFMIYKVYEIIFS